MKKMRKKSMSKRLRPMGMGGRSPISSPQTEAEGSVGMFGRHSAKRTRRKRAKK